MTKKILITAGQVYGKLDDNKLLGNRTKGKWAVQLALWLKGVYGNDAEVTVLVPDILDELLMSELIKNPIKFFRHKGFDEYRQKCLELAPLMDAAIMASAVVNWIPKEPFKGKMPTDKQEMNIPFYLAPRVINEMKQKNPKLTLIGCKMLIDSEPEDLIEAAYNVLLNSKSNMVIANDMGHGLRTKHIVYQDRSVITYDDYFEGFYMAIADAIYDKHYRTEYEGWGTNCFDQGATAEACKIFDQIVDENRKRFFKPLKKDSRVFGSVLVPINRGLAFESWIVSPREKNELFTSKEATRVSGASDLDAGVIQTGSNTHVTGKKASLNAPLLIRVAKKYQPKAVLHLHEQLPDAPTVPYAPPGTFRDGNRDIPADTFNIEHHGFIKCIY